MIVPFVLHSAWMPSAVPVLPGSIPRVKFSDELDRVNELPDDLAECAREVARELDEGEPMGALKVDR
jgi:all-trans-8'-apo-beta-carotenal 15,15'-oxygenase